MVPVGFLGIPHDDNSSYLKGAAEAPAAVRRELACDAYSLWSETGVDLAAPGRLVDLGDVAFDTEIDPWLSIERAVDAALVDGGRLICLGGDHAITHPVLRAVHRRHGPVTLVHIDAHADLYDAYQDNPRSHASPFARIMEQGLARRLIQIGLRTVNDHHRAQFQRFGVDVIEAAQWTGTLPFAPSGPVYLSVDLDGLDPAYAPGVSHREPGGLSPRDVIRVIHALGARLVAADIVEYNPRCDVSNLTALVTTKLLKEIAGAMALG